MRGYLPDDGRSPLSELARFLLIALAGEVFSALVGPAIRRAVDRRTSR